jgi:hypothetical protein
MTMAGSATFDAGPDNMRLYLHVTDLVISNVNDHHSQALPPPKPNHINSPPTMSNIVPTVARQALRIASRRYPTSTFARSLRVTPAARRSYVSETKPSNATVNLDSTIKAEKDAYLSQTGERVQDATMPTTGMAADAMMSPTAGKHVSPLSYDIMLTPQASSSRPQSWTKDRAQSTSTCRPLLPWIPASSTPSCPS